MSEFQLCSDYTPCGDQPQAITTLIDGLNANEAHQVLLGSTGSGKTFTMANVIQSIGWPTLVIAPNKTLAAQLYGEFKGLFPNNAVEYFVSYYDYYQPEAYVPSTNTYIEKDASVNEEIDRLRHAATRSLLSRKDVIIVASVSCIYGIGSSEAYAGLRVQVQVGEELDRNALLRALVNIQYNRNDYDFHRGTFRVRGDIVEVFPASEDTTAIRIEFFGDDVERITDIDPLRGTVRSDLDNITIFPASHYVTYDEDREQAIESIRGELGERLQELAVEGQLVEEQRLRERTLYDLEMLSAMGYCNGIENYSRHLTGRAQGEPPPTLVDYFPKPFLCVLDESHVTLPQLRAMYRGDQSRKGTLVEHGFRLPSAMDNRPLQFDEWLARTNNVVHVSATPGDWELEQTGGVIAEQVVRPTGLLDPRIDVRPAAVQVDDLLEEIRKRTKDGDRVLVTTLTKRMSENLTDYMRDVGVRVRYLHSDIATLERIAIIRDLRRGVFDVLVGINLLREGLDIPEVSLVAILDADKEGFLRSRRSLIQTMGRAARNVRGTVILYADTMTKSMRAAIDETNRRRSKQEQHNQEHGITPTTISKPIFELEIPDDDAVADTNTDGVGHKAPAIEGLSADQIHKKIETLRDRMWKLARDEEFEEASKVRDAMHRWEKLALTLG
jgi:excinuclease ABC subunit B